MYALNVRTGKLVWSTGADGEIDSSPAYASGTIFIGDNSGTLTALDARTGAVRWQARSFSRLPLRARVLLRDADSRLRARLRLEHRRHGLRLRGRHRQPAVGAPRRDVRLHGARRLGSEGLRRHLRRQVLRARRRDRRYALGARDAGRRPRCADRDGRARLLRTCGICGQKGVRSAKKGPNGTYALDARTGKLVWRFPDGQYSPVVADERAGLHRSARRRRLRGLESARSSR